MQTENAGSLISDTLVLSSVYLAREVIIDIYQPSINFDPAKVSLLLINDGQDLLNMNFGKILDRLYRGNDIEPVLCVGIHCSADRKNEYGTAKFLDYKGRGSKALAYQQFVLLELLPFLQSTFPGFTFKTKSFCGFSLGGLNALDTVWNHPGEFSRAGIFSGSLWWRNVSHEDPAYDERNHRIMHNQIKNGSFAPGLQFFFETGTLDETNDRNNNGIIDSIDDTLSLIEELIAKGYDPGKDIRYLELKNGKHDVATWARAFPEFLKWGWGKQ
ncbi:MAG: alpha/beta hydrolase-fold protein [Ginsengibacter sp.]